MNLVFSGTANLVTEALDMKVVAPFPRKLAGAAAEFAPKTITVAIRGTMSKPEYEIAKAIAKAVEESGRELLKHKGGDVLGGLLGGGKDKKK
jgi:hypothetical protein